MTTIERIGQFTIAQHGRIFILIDRSMAGGHEIYYTEHEARETALDRVDLVDRIAATVH